MPWNPEDLERIRRVLKVPAEKLHLDILRTCMSRLERESPDTIATVQELLDDLEGLKVTRRTIRGDANNAMIQAGSVKWAPGQRSEGVELERHDALEELASALYINLPGYYEYGQSSSSYTLERS